MSEGVQLITRPLGEILLAKGQIRKFQLDFLLQLQNEYKNSQRQVRIGELLVKHRAITASAIEQALRAQHEGPLESVTEILKVFEREMSFRTRLEER